MTRFNLALLLILALLIASPAAKAETYNTCTGFITSLPTVISTPGTWCLKQDLATAITSGNAITINTNNVTIDCNNFKLGGLAAGVSTTADGIVAIGRLNGVVRNCNIRGFLHGVAFYTGGGGHTIENNRFDGNTYTSVLIEGDGSVVQHNRIFDTGGSTGIGNHSAIGINALDSVDLIDNTISNVTAKTGGNGDAIGIYTDLNTSGSISGNRIRGLLKDGGGVALGILNHDSGRLALVDNQVVGDGSVGSEGFECTTKDGRAKDNVLNGFETGIVGCSDDGGNVIAP
jgi:hypothetical protein